MLRRAVFTARPPAGDFILRPTGLTWGIGRCTADGSIVQMAAGERVKNVAIAMLVKWARADRTDAWETFGAGSYRLVEGSRSNA